MREALRALIAAAFALLVALLVTGAGVQGSWLLCRSQKTVHRTCCCKTKASLDALSRSTEQRPDELRRAPCCDPIDAAVSAVPPSTSSTVAFALPPPVLLEVATPAVRRIERVTSLDAAGVVDRTPRVPTGPPIPIRHRALLI